jgi:hypothetical protein
LESSGMEIQIRMVGGCPKCADHGPVAFDTQVPGAGKDCATQARCQNANAPPERAGRCGFAILKALSDDAQVR